MVSSSKILTVSYGTFSCTAEGFEDPLAVVKESTHFFRGVVREDRFFGAEPPQFDPELAAQLLQAQVTADAQSGRLVLRGPLADAAVPATQDRAEVAGSDVVGPDADRRMEAALEEAARRAAAEAAEEAAAAEQAAEEARRSRPEAPAPAPQRAVDTEGLSGDDSLSAEAAFFAADAGATPLASFDESDAEDMAAPRGASVPQAEPVGSDDSVAAKLRRIRAVVSGGGVAAQVPDVAEDADIEGDDTQASVSAMLGTLASQPPVGQAPQADEDANETDPEDAPIDFSSLQDAGWEDENWDDEELAWGDEETDEAVSAAADVEPEDVAEPEAGTVTPSAPFALTPDLAAAADEVADPVAADHAAPAKAPTPRRVRVVKVTRAAFDTAIASGAIEETPAASSLSADDEQDLARELEAVKAELAAGLDDDWEDLDDLDQIGAERQAASDEGDAKATPLRTEALLTDLEVEVEEADAWTEDALDLDEDDFDDDEDVAAGAWDEAEWDDEEAQDVAASAAPHDDLLDEDDFLDDEEDSLLDDPADAEEFAAAFAESQDDDLEGDELDEFERQELEAELTQSARQEVRKAVKLSSPARVMLTETSVEDNDTSRILDETNTQLEEPEGNRRRSAIAHLRAAVAATRADRLLGRKKDAEAQAQPYREDLADVVRPRRPAPAPQAPTARPAAARPVSEATPRPAPLKLVAEQRVEDAVDIPEAPLRPRRVTLADLDEQAPSGAQGDFAAYAESVGAHDLPELLEAAASYLSYVEGRAQFSRPQLMTKVRQVEGEDTSREDRLRSFGQLLREGKIEKTGGGRFTVSDRISFKPSARAAG